MMNICVKVWRTLFIIYVCGILITIYEQQWYLGQHTHINGDRDDILQILGLVGQGLEDHCCWILLEESASEKSTD